MVQNREKFLKFFDKNELHPELLSHDDLQKKLFSFIVFGVREPADLIDKQK